MFFAFLSHSIKNRSPAKTITENQNHKEFYMKKQNQNNDTKHLEDALFNNPVVSATDTTGYVPTLPYTDEKADNISEMMSVPVSPPSDK